MEESWELTNRPTDWSECRWSDIVDGALLCSVLLLSALCARRRSWRALPYPPYCVGCCGFHPKMCVLPRRPLSPKKSYKCPCTIVPYFSFPNFLCSLSFLLFPYVSFLLLFFYFLFHRLRKPITLQNIDVSFSESCKIVSEYSTSYLGKLEKLSIHFLHSAKCAWLVILSFFHYSYKRRNLF